MRDAKKIKTPASEALAEVSELVQRQTTVYADRRRALALARVRPGNFAAVAGQQDAWDVAWDCNTDACEIEDLYRKNGKSQVILKRVLDQRVDL